MKTISAAALAGLQSGALTMQVLMRLQFASGDLYLCTGRRSVDWYNVAKEWNFGPNAAGWSVSGATITQNAQSITIVSTGADPIISTSGFSVVGSNNTVVRVRYRRVAGTFWDGSVFYGTNAHGFDAGYYKNIADGAFSEIGLWMESQWNMAALTAGGTDWVNNTITSLRIDMGNSALDQFEVDHVRIVDPVTYQPLKVIASIAAIEDRVNDVPGIELSVSGVDPSLIAIALGEQVRGRPLRLYTAIINSATGALFDVWQMWAGQMSTMSIHHQDQQASIKLTAEHRGVAFARARPLRYTDAEQRALHPGDASLKYIISQSETHDIWPAASFWKQG